MPLVCMTGFELPNRLSSYLSLSTHCEAGTGEELCGKCLEILAVYKIPLESIIAWVFDTSASNTGIHQGCCTLLEQALGCAILLDAYCITWLSLTAINYSGSHKPIEKKIPHVQTLKFPTNSSYHSVSNIIISQIYKDFIENSWVPALTYYTQLGWVQVIPCLWQKRSSTKGIQQLVYCRRTPLL